VVYVFEVSAELDRKVLILSLLINADDFAPELLTQVSCNRNKRGKIVVLRDAKFPPRETVAHFHQIARLLSKGITDKRVSRGRLDQSAAD
jgi:cephalosporin hydroxylase